MNRRLFFLGLTGLAGCTRDRRPRLNVYNWSNYVAPETVPNFEREFGVTVRYGVYESNEEMLAKALTGNSGWDVVFPSNYLIRPMRENGLLASVRHEWLKNLAIWSRAFKLRRGTRSCSGVFPTCGARAASCSIANPARRPPPGPICGGRNFATGSRC